jgi:ABC-type nitrate/sulfonate/bicarbonate transport system substrate-binding protein
MGSQMVRAGAALLGAVALFGASTGSGASADLDTVNVGRAIVDAFAFTTLEVGESAHIWDKVGIKLNISSFKGDGQLQQALTAGSVDVGLGSGPAMGYRAKGVPAIAVAVMYTAPTDMGLVIASNGQVKTVADLKGKTVAVTTAGSLTDWLVHELAKKEGWGPDGITSLAMGSTEARVAALESGAIAGSVGDIGVGYQLEEQGKGKVFQNFGFVQKFITHVIFATDDMVAKRPDVVKRFLKGWFLTVAYMKTHRAETIKASEAVLQEPDSVVAKLYDNDMSSMSNDGDFDPQSVAAVATSLKDIGILDTVPDPKTLYTTKFVPVR